MTIRHILLGLMACLMLAATAQNQNQNEEPEWYLGEVVSDSFVRGNDFEYYYQPSATDMEQQRRKGEVTYFLNSPAGLNTKKVRDLVDRIMASYDDISAVSTWHMTSGNYWKEFRHEKNKFRFSVGRKTLDDGGHYVSITESANFYKSLGKKGEKASQKTSKKTSSTKRSTRDRKQVVADDDDDTPVAELLTDDEDEDIETVQQPVVSDKEQRREARKREEALKREQREARQREQEQKRAEAKALKQAQKEAEKQRKAEEKKQKEEEKRLKREQEKQQREQARKEREQARRDKLAERKQAAAAVAPTAPATESRFHYTDVALWLSEKYDFTQLADDGSSCRMFSTAVKDTEMAKLAIKNALKGSDARMAVPWRLNSETQEVETGYTVDDHVLVFAIGKTDNGNVALTVTEVSAEQFELFRQNLTRNK